MNMYFTFISHLLHLYGPDSPWTLVRNVFKMDQLNSKSTNARVSGIHATCISPVWAWIPWALVRILFKMDQLNFKSTNEQVFAVNLTSILHVWAWALANITISCQCWNIPSIWPAPMNRYLTYISHLFHLFEPEPTEPSPEIWSKWIN